MTKISNVRLAWLAMVELDPEVASALAELQSIRQLDKEQEGGHIQRGVSKNAPQPAGVRVKGLVDYLWQEFCELPDRTSPDDYPDHALVTQKELTAIVETWAEISALETQEEEAVAVKQPQQGGYEAVREARAQARREFAPLRAKMIERVIAKAHPTPVQKEEESQTVSEDMVERAVRVLRRTMHMTPEERARAVLTAALVKP